MWRAGISGARPAAPIVALHAGEVVIHLVGDVALEDTHDLGFGAAFKAAPFDVGVVPWFELMRGEHDPPQGVVGLPVAAAGPAGDGPSCRRRRESGPPRQASPGSLRGDPFGVVAGGDEQQGGGADPDS